jgi:predicted O-methyltransferase YrrM
MLTWTGDGTFEVDGIAYRCLTSLTQGGPEADQFLVLKNRAVLERYQALIEADRPQRILELGIYAGGSTALFAQLARPQHLAALDYSPDPQPGLARFVAEHGLDDVVHLHYGVDQADTGALDEILHEFDGPVDLVIDDASHLEPQTRASFDRIYPHLRPGGAYVIEDWAWAHQIFPHKDARYQDVTPPSVFIIGILLVAARHPDVIAEVVVDKKWTLVRRGAAELDAGFSIAGWLDPVGRRIVEQAATVRSRTPKP